MCTKFRRADIIDDLYYLNIEIQSKRSVKLLTLLQTWFLKRKKLKFQTINGSNTYSNILHNWIAGFLTMAKTQAYIASQVILYNG